jgi:hypothetical protein
MQLRILLWSSGTWKRCVCWIRRINESKSAYLIQGSKTGQAIPRTQSGYINNMEDIYDALRHYFQLDCSSICKWSRNPVDMFQLFKYVGDHNPIQRAEEEHKGLEKISSSYQFVGKSIGVVHSRT